MVARVLIGIVAGVVLVASIALGAGSAWLWTTFGGADGAVRSLGEIQTAARTVVIDVDAVGASVPFDIPGTVELAVDGGSPLSVVAGPTADIDRLVFGSEYDVASLEDGAWVLASVPGVRPTPSATDAVGMVTATGDPAVLDVAAVAPGSLAIIRDEDDTSALVLELRLVVADAGVIATIGAGIALFGIIVAMVLMWAAVLGLRGRGRHA